MHVVLRPGARLGLDPAGGETDEGGGVLEVEFLFDTRAVRIYGFWAEVKLFGNGVRVFGFADELEDFELAPFRNQRFFRRT